MAQECGFFDAYLVGEEYDRVYVAAQLASYFASFIGNGVFGHSLQQLEVSAQDTPNMSTKVLSGQGWINGYWYRNTDAYTLNHSVADGVLSRIDTVVLRWSNSDRAMYLKVLEGTPSANPVAPAIVRDADYYDLGLAHVSVPAGSIRITQAQIQDLRENSAYCGLVTGLVDQIDLTDLWNQFEQYFEEFKLKYEKDYDTWTKEQKQAYLDYIAQLKADYDAYVAATQKDYDEWTAEKKTEWAAWVTDQMAQFTTWVNSEKDVYNTWTEQQRQAYMDWYTINTVAWEKMILEWFEKIKGQISEDLGVKLQLQINELKAEEPTVEVANITHTHNAYITADMFTTTYACGVQGAGIGPCGGGALVSTSLQYSMPDKGNITIKAKDGFGTVEGVNELSEDMYGVLFENNITSLVVMLHGDKSAQSS